METTDDIIKDEGGIVLQPYFCTARKLTWLIGRNIEDRPLKKPEIAILREHGLEEGAKILFNIELESLYKELVMYGVPLFNLPEEKKNIILNLAYNMGVTRFNPKTWPKFFAAIKEKNWKNASIQMQFTDNSMKKESKWYQQTKNRAVRLTKAMENI